MGNYLGAPSKGDYVEVSKGKRPLYTNIPAFLIDKLESILLWATYGSSKPSNYFMEGGFAPVDEYGPEKVLSVKGVIPECLNGEFVRVGPNPKFEPVAKYHWFDGDGMLHGLRIKDGSVTYVSRYVKTAKLEQEEYWGGAKFRKIGDLVGKSGLLSILIFRLRTMLGVVDISNGGAVANTALTFHTNKLLALCEGDAPYIIRVFADGDLETIGRLDYDKKLDHSFTAHPKVDPDTGDMFTFGHNIIAPPYIKYRVVSKDGVMGDVVPLTLDGPNPMHDFAITENYSVFIESPLYFNPKDMVKKNQGPLEFDKNKPLRVGVLPRYAKNESQIRWFNFSSGLVVHTVNAWEEGDEVVLYSCRLPDFDLTGVSSPLEGEGKADYLWEHRVNLKTGESSERQLGEFFTDFPRINEDFTGRKNRYVYTSVLKDQVFITGLAKFDLSLEPELGKKALEVGGNVTGVYWHGEGRYGSEAVYVPKNPGRDVKEDDGYLVFFVRDEKQGKSEVVVLDAKTLSPDPVAVIELPTMVPHGFHAMFVTEDQLQSQKS